MESSTVPKSPKKSTPESHTQTKDARNSTREQLIATEEPIRPPPISPDPPNTQKVHNLPAAAQPAQHSNAVIPTAETSFPTTTSIPLAYLRVSHPTSPIPRPAQHSQTIQTIRTVPPQSQQPFTAAFLPDPSHLPEQPTNHVEPNSTPTATSQSQSQSRKRSYLCLLGMLVFVGVICAVIYGSQAVIDKRDGGRRPDLWNKTGVIEGSD